MLNRCRVLVVDDDPDCVGLVVASLEADHDVIGVGDPFAAIEKLRSETFDLLVTDWKMPDVNGIELIAWVRSHRPLMGTILLTGRGEDLLTSVATGDRQMVVMLMKPVSAIKLRTTVETLGALVGIRRRVAEQKG